MIENLCNVGLLWGWDGVRMLCIFLSYTPKIRRFRYEGRDLDDNAQVQHVNFRPLRCMGVLQRPYCKTARDGLLQPRSGYGATCVGRGWSAMLQSSWNSCLCFVPFVSLAQRELLCLL